MEIVDPPSPVASVVIATYRRAARLAACLEGLRAQSLRVDEVIVVVYTLDEESAALVESAADEWPELRCLRIESRGTVAAYNLGLAAARGAIVAYVDDDAVPAVDWLERIVRAFEADERIAAVGGRDIVVMDGQVLRARKRRLPSSSAAPPDVGRIQWFGRMIANHHVGQGEARDVDVLKGANMSFRRAKVIGHGFDERLFGEGATVHSELSICLPLRRCGLRVVYDPNIVVMHYPAPRLFGGDRDDLRREALFANAHNETLEILDYFGPVQRATYAVWGVAVGASGAPGVAVLLRDLITGRPEAWSRFRAAQYGRLVAWRTRRLPRRSGDLARAGEM